MLLYLYTQCLRYNIYSAWFLGIRISTCLLYELWWGKSALHYCAEHGHASVADILIRAKADVNAVDNTSLCIVN